LLTESLSRDGPDSIVGDRIIVVVQKQRSFGAESPGSSSLGITNKVRRGDIRHAVVVRAKKELQRKDGGLIRFDDNACVLINKTGDPIGTRLTSMLLDGICFRKYLWMLQVLLELNCATSSGRRYYRWHRYMYERQTWNEYGRSRRTRTPEALD
jgi:ribosomal protein L14